MAYNIFIFGDSPSDEPILDFFLGTAGTIDIYWESVGRKLNLPIISTLTERADCEQGLALSADTLVLFKNEVAQLASYWTKGDPKVGVPEDFFQRINVLMDGINYAIDKGLELIIA